MLCCTYLLSEGLILAAGVCPSLLCRAVSCAVSNSDSISTAVASDLTHFLDSKDCLPENLLVCGYTAALAETQLDTAQVS